MLTVAALGCAPRAAEGPAPAPAPSMARAVSPAPAPIAPVTPSQPAAKVRSAVASRERLARSCDDKDLDACNDLGWDLRKGGHGPQDQPRAFELFSRACEGGEEQGCRLLADYYREGVVVARDLARADALERRGASDKAPVKYRFLMRSLEQNEADCEAGDFVSCMDAARKGAVAPDVEELVAACRRGVRTACWDLHSRWDSKRELVLSAWSDACRAGELDSCELLLNPKARTWVLSRQHPELPQGAERDALLEAGCRHGGTGWCRELAEKDEGRALGLLKLGCPDRRRRFDPYGLDGRACELLGDRFATGSGVAKDGPRAVEAYRRGCWEERTRSDGACVKLASAFEAGELVPRDTARAKEVWALLCAAGSDQCRHFKRCEVFLGCYPDQVFNGH